MEGNPPNWTDPSGRCVGPLALVCLGVAVAGGAFTGGFIYGAASEIGRGGSVGDVVGQGLVWGGGSAAVAGGVMLGGVGIVGGAKLAGGALLAGSSWLAAHPVVAGALIGGELEWARQFSVNLADGMDIFHAGYHENIDEGEIAKSAFWSALTAGVWNRAGVFSAIGKNGIRNVLNPRILAGEFVQKLIPTATIYGSLGSAASSIVSSAVTDLLSDQDPLSSFTWSNLFSSTFWGGLTGNLTAKYQVWTNPASKITRSGAVLKPLMTMRWGHGSRWKRGLAYAGIGLLTSAPQSIISVVSGSSTPSCAAALGPLSGLSNVASMFESSWVGYLTSGFIASTFTSVRSSQLCTP